VTLEPEGWQRRQVLLLFSRIRRPQLESGRSQQVLGRARLRALDCGAACEHHRRCDRD